jgi:chromosome segregation ATPase
MRNGIFQTVRPRVFHHPLHSPAGRRVRLPFALVAGVLALGVAAGVTLAQEQPQPAPQPKETGPSEQERAFDAQARELEARRAELARSLQQAEMQLQQLVLEQDQQRRQLQKELDSIRERLRDVDSQLADLPRQRLRAKYLAAVQTLEQARGKRQQAEEQAQAARLAEEDAAIAVERLRQLLGQMPSVPPESARGEPRHAQRTERVERELQERQGLDQRREPELSRGLPAVPEPMRTVEPPGCPAGKAGEQQGSAEIRRHHLQQQLENLQGEIRSAGEQIKAVTAQMDATRENLNREIAAVRTDVQRMGRTLGRIELERLEAQGRLKTSVEELQSHLEQVQQLCQARRTLDIALLQAHISTVGSAAYR